MRKTMIGRYFNVGDVLSVVTGKVVSPRGMEGVHNILSYMTGEDLSLLYLPEALPKCRQHLIDQFPQLATSEVKSAVDEFVGKCTTDMDNISFSVLLNESIFARSGLYVVLPFFVKPIRPSN